MLIGHKNALNTHTHECDDLYPREPPCIVWLYYTCSYTVALSPSIIPSFAVLHTEKFSVCNTAKLEIVLGDILNLAALHGDIRVIFFSA